MGNAGCWERRPLVNAVRPVDVWDVGGDDVTVYQLYAPALSDAEEMPTQEGFGSPQFTAQLYAARHGDEAALDAIKSASLMTCICAVCPEDEPQVATEQCTECDLFLCAGCSATVHRLPSHKTHRPHTLTGGADTKARPRCGDEFANTNNSASDANPGAANSSRQHTDNISVVGA
eukprot:gene3365-18579_t